MGFLSRLRNGSGGRRRSAGPVDAAALVDGGAVLLDVRERSEFDAGHVPGARNIPLGRLETGTGTAGLRDDQVVVTVCRSGARSARAARILAGAGYEVVNLSGGMHAWSRHGLPVVDRRGRPGRVA